MRLAIPAAGHIARLKRRLKVGGVPAIYVNDNFTRWQSDFRELVAICSQLDAPGAPLLRQLAPEHDDDLVLKPSTRASTPARCRRCWRSWASVA